MTPEHQPTNPSPDYQRPPIPHPPDLFERDFTNLPADPATWTPETEDAYINRLRADWPTMAKGWAKLGAKPQYQRRRWRGRGGRKARGAA